MVKSGGHRSTDPADNIIDYVEISFINTGPVRFPLGQKKFSVIGLGLKKDTPVQTRPVC